jgi:hypothetical protein
MQITFNLPHVFHPGATPEENAPVLQALMDALIAINVAYLRQTPLCKGLYDSGVVYGRTYWWEPIPALYTRGFGDCKSLAAALVAEYRVRRNTPANAVFRWIRNADGSTDFHILVQTPYGFEDPSRKLGMGADELRWFQR